MALALPCLIPMGVNLSKAFRNASDDSAENPPLQANKVRTRSVVDRLIAGGRGSPISHWSDQHLEKQIKTNSALRAHADEVRAAHAASRC